MWRRVWSLLVVSLGALALVLALPPAAGADAPLPEACDTLDSTPLPGRTGPQAELISVARSLAENGELDAAEHLFELARTSRPVDPAAGTGLAYVQARRLAADEAVAAGQAIAKRRVADRDATEEEDERLEAEVEACFDQARRLDKDDEAAAAGPAPVGTTAATSASDRWDSFFADWVDPAGKVALPALGLLAVLLVLGRLLTPLAAPPDARAWGKWWRRGAWWLGLGLVVFSVLRVVLSPLAAEPGERGGGLLWILWAGLIAAAVAAFWCARTAPWINRRQRSVLEAATGRGATLPLPPSGGAQAVPGQPGDRDATAGSVGVGGASGATSTGARSTLQRVAGVSRRLAPVLGLALLVGGLVALTLARAGTWGESAGGRAWMTTVLLALLGVVLLAVGWGHVLRLRIQVKKGTDADASATAFVLGSLQELGASPPRGLKVPHQTDVTDLPSGALSSLPEGKVAAAAVAALALLARPTSWHLTVEDAGDDRLVATLVRHGSVADTAVLDGGPFLRGRSPQLPAGDGDEGDAPPSPERAALLTAAAAFALTQLALRHPELNAGLCGVSRWESVAAQVVATRQVEPPRSVQYRRELLAYAVQTDPRNVLARTAYVQVLGEKAIEVPAMAADARRLTDLRAIVEGQVGRESPSHARGYLPVRLRISHSRTAALLNLAVERRRSSDPVVYGQWPVDWRAAVVECQRLTGFLVAEGVDEAVRPFLEELVPVTKSLIGGLAAIRPPNGDMTALEEWAGERPDDPVASLDATYDEACTRALRDDDQGALCLLELVAGSSKLRALMRQDPAFAGIRDTAGTADQREKRTSFWALAAEPDPPFIDLPPFGKKNSVLRDLGLVSARDVFVGTSDGGAALATALEYPATVTAAWHAFAVLAGPRGARSRYLDAREMRLLEACGIRSDADLTRRSAVAGGGESLQQDLVATARKLDVRPPTPVEVQEMLVLPPP